MASRMEQSGGGGNVMKELATASEGWCGEGGWYVGVKDLDVVVIG